MRELSRTARCHAALRTTPPQPSISHRHNRQPSHGAAAAHDMFSPGPPVEGGEVGFRGTWEQASTRSSVSRRSAHTRTSSHASQAFLMLHAWRMPTRDAYPAAVR